MNTEKMLNTIRIKHSFAVKAGNGIPISIGTGPLKIKLYSH